MESRPKILFLLHIPPPVHGSSVMGLSIKDSTLINQQFDCYYINLLASKHVSDSGKISLRKIFDFMLIYKRILKHLLNNKPDLCYLALTATGSAFYKDLLIVFLLKLFNVRRVYHLHNKGVSLHANNIISRWSYNYVFSGADVILLSKNLYPDIKAFVPESNIYICPNGINDATALYDHLFYGARRLYTNQASLTTTILFLSNLSKSKGAFILLDACALLKRNNVSFNCLFVGSEGDISADEFNSRANSLGLTDCVTYLGSRYDEEKYQAFKEADIFVFPTQYETFGLVNLEAMQHALPIISTLEGGIPDVIDDCVTGFLIPKQDSVALFEKLVLLVNNPALRQKMGQAGRRKYELEFTLERFENNITSILTTLLIDQHPEPLNHVYATTAD